MTDPGMMADELEALADKARSASSYVDRADAHAALAGAAPVLARRLARLLRAAEAVLAECDAEEWCLVCIREGREEHGKECPVPILRAALEAGE